MADMTTTEKRMNQFDPVLSLHLGLIKPERDAILTVYPTGWRNQSATMPVDRLEFVSGLRLLGLSQTQREEVMREFNNRGAFAARLKACDFVDKAFQPLLS